MIGLVFISPGKEFYKLLSPNMNAELTNKLMAHNQKSFLKTSVDYFINLIKGDLGTSTRYNENVSGLIYQHILVTLFITVTAFILQFIFSAIFAYYTSSHPNRWVDKFADKLSSIMYSFSTIIVAPILILVFSFSLQIFPIEGFPNFIESKNPITIFTTYIYYITLPLASLIISLMPVYYKYFREIFFDISNKPYILYLKSLGINKQKIFFKNILPNSMNSILSIVGIDLGFLLSGSLITEIIFGIPGVGRLFYEAIFAKDYQLTLACGLYSAFIFLLLNFIIDILRILIDKRLLYSLR